LPFYKQTNALSFISKQGLALAFLALFVSLASTFLSYTGKTSGMDWLLYDSAMTISQLTAADDIIIVDIDEKSLNTLGRWPWPRQTHAKLLDILNLAQTRVVIFDILFPELDTDNHPSDLRFAQAIKDHGEVILPIYLETLGQQGQVIENPPHRLFYNEAKALGHAHLHADLDGVIRSVFLKEGVGTPFWPHLSLALTTLLESDNETKRTKIIPGNRSEERAPKTQAMGISRDFHNLLPMPAMDQGFRHYSYSDLLEGTINLDNLKGKIVFVGATAAGLGDTLATPVGTMDGVELNAWVFQALRQDKMIRSLTPATLSFITFLTVMGSVLVLGRLSPRLFLIFSVLSAVTIMAISTYVLLFKNLWLAPSSALIGIVVFFPLWSWLRAESILRYLRAEIETLSQQSSPHYDNKNRTKAAQAFLEKTGMIEPNSRQATSKGRQAIAALFASHQATAENDQGADSFWQTQLAKYDAGDSAPLEKHKGVEVIARTLSQLTTIKENDKKNRQLIEKSLSRLQDAVCITDLCGEITFTNARFKEWFEHDKNSKLSLLEHFTHLELKSGQSWSQVIASLYQTNTLFTDEALLTQADAQVSSTVKHTSKVHLLCQASLVSINEIYDDTLIFTFTDITQLKAAENARTEALSFLSHDLRSPMVSVLAILDRHRPPESQIIDRKQAQRLPEDALQNIELLVRKNLDYAESFLQLSKADALAETNMSPCDLHAVLDGAQVVANALAAPKDIKVVTERCDDDVWVQGDIALLERALNNLISNAVKFSPKGSRLTLKLTKHEQEALFSVQDQGIGIDSTDQATIFERFTRLKNAENVKGVGLGLNFVATVIKKHKGHITLSSTLNKGSTFKIHLPALSEQELFEFDS